MAKIDELKAEHKVCSASSATLIGLSETENRDFTPEELLQLEKNKSRMETLGHQIGAENKKLDAVHAIVNRSFGHLYNESGKSATKQRNQFGVGITALSPSESVAALDGNRTVAFGVGECIRAMVCGYSPSTPSEVRAAMSEGINTAGGFMVPSFLSGDLIDLARSQSVLIKAGMTTLVLEGGDMSIARVTSSPTPEVKSELASFTPQDFGLGSVTLTPRTVGVYIECSREIIEDAPNFVQLISEQLGKTMGASMDKFGLLGFNLGGGLMADPLISETGSSGAISWSKVATAGTTVRVANHVPSGCVTYPTLADAMYNAVSGDGASSAKLWQGRPPSLEQTQFLDTTNSTATKLVIGDFSKYAIGIKTGLQIEVSASSGDMFKKHGVAIKATLRADYALLDSTAFFRLTGLTV